MKIERLPEYLTTAVVTLLGVGFAAYCGRMTGSGQLNLIFSIIAAVLALAVSIKMRAVIWILIPLTWLLTGRVPLFVVPFALRDLVVMFVVSVVLVLIALKVIRRKVQYDLLDLCALITLIYLAATFVRNPVGTVAMGAERVGGKPYFDVFVGALAYLVIVRADLPPRLARILPVVFALSWLIQGSISTLTYHFPQTVPVITKFYTGVNSSSYDALDYFSSIRSAVEDRQAHLSYISNGLILLLCAYFRPLGLLNPTRPGRFILLIIACGAALKSGHRLSVFDLGMVLILVSYFRRGMIDIWRVTAVGIPVLALVVIMHGTVFTLPMAAQRALSFLPGQWDPQAVDDARGSLEWRFQLWQEVLTSDKYIRNKLLGDGFGFSAGEFQAIQFASSYGAGDQSLENSMVNGSLHSGPLSAIRTVGVVGFIPFLWLLYLVTRRAAFTIRRAQGSPFEPLAYIVAIPLIYEPVRYIFVFGAYDNTLVNSLVGIALMKLINHALDQTVTPTIELRKDGRFQFHGARLQTLESQSGKACQLHLAISIGNTKSSANKGEKTTMRPQIGADSSQRR